MASIVLGLTVAAAMWRESASDLGTAFTGEKPPARQPMTREASPACLLSWTGSRGD